MAETNLDKIVRRLRQKYWDWGYRRPIKTSAEYLGSTAPVWEHPTRPGYFFLGLLNIVAFIVMLILISATTDYYQSDCLPGTILLRNTLNFYFFLNGLSLMYFSKNEIGSDKQWSRYITVSAVINVLGLLNDLGLLVFMLVEDSTCAEDDSSDYGTAIAMIVVALIHIVLYTLLLVYTIKKLYIGSQPLAFSKT